MDVAQATELRVPIPTLRTAYWRQLAQLAEHWEARNKRRVFNQQRNSIRHPCTAPPGPILPVRNFPLSPSHGSAAALSVASNCPMGWRSAQPPTRDRWQRHRVNVIALPRQVDLSAAAASEQISRKKASAARKGQS
jgi:hypothetical protein